MSKYNNVKPDHFKTAGREPQGRDVVHEIQRQQFGELNAKRPQGKKAVGTAPRKRNSGK
jgi:hypothetical protein